MDLRQTSERLQARLLELEASGQEGFEGLVRDAYSEVTGVSLRLQKAGPQGGLDAIDADEETVVIAGIEAKRYGSTTELRLGELKAKLLDAATRKGKAIELWILAASKEVPGDDVAELRSLGDQFGVGVEVFDWRSEGDLLAPLPLLLVLAPEASRRHLGSEAAQSLRSAAKHPRFADAKRIFLARLTRPDLGLSYAARTVRTKIGETLMSRQDAKALLQNPVDIANPSRIWEPRENHCRLLQGWMKTAGSTPICAAIGDEGAGKSWLMFDWWQRQTQGEQPPLILWFAARDVAAGSLEGLIGAALSKWIDKPKKDANFWSRRVELWRRVNEGSGVPFIWLMLDGTNEGTAQRFVAACLDEAVSSRWKGSAGILLSDRPGHWDRTFKKGIFLDTAPMIVEVEPFTEPERDSLLGKHGKSPGEFSRTVLQIIKWPRWFEVAAEMFSREHDWSAYSAEHLMLKYAQHRLRERGQISALNDEEFRDFVARLGAEAKDDWGMTFSRADLKERLSRSTGRPEKEVVDAIDDIAAGIWLGTNEGNQFKIDETVLPFAIALALLNDVRGAITEEEADSGCAKFLGALEEQDIGVRILGATVSLSFLHSKISGHVQKALMKRWLMSHNFSSLHFELAWRIGAANPDALFSVAEDIWLVRSGGFSVDETLIKALANMATDGQRQAEVIAFMARWAATYWPYPKDGEFFGDEATAADRQKAAIQTGRNVESLRTLLGEAAFAAAGLRCVEPGVSASWLAHRVFAIATHLPRAPLKSVLYRWALSRAIMGRARHYEDIAWLLRENRHDGPAAAQTLIETVEELLAVGSNEVQRMALALLEAHGGSDAAAKLESLGKASTTYRSGSSDRDARLVDGEVILSEDSRRAERGSIWLLSKFAFDPAAQIGEANRERLERYARQFPVEKLHLGRQRGDADLDLEHAEPALARWVPEHLADLYRRFLVTVEMRDESGLLGFCLDVGNIHILLTEDLQVGIATLLSSRLSTKGAKWDQIEEALLSSALFDKSPPDQLRLWKRFGAPSSVSNELASLIRAIPEERVADLEPELDLEGNVDRLVGWLGFILLSGTTKLPERWDALPRLFRHKDDTVRSLAMRIAEAANHMHSAEQIYEQGWSAWKDGKHVYENWAGSALLCRVSTEENFLDISARIDPQWSSDLWERFDFVPRYRDPFRAFLINSVERELKPPPTRSYPEYHCSPDVATEKLLALEPELLARYADHLFDAKKFLSFSRFEWPRLSILRATFANDPDEAVRLWRRLDEQKSGIRSSSVEFDALPFEAASRLKVNELRDELMMRPSNDWELMTLGATIIQTDRTEWAINWIQTTLQKAESTGHLARAITIAGFLDNSESVRAFWALELAEPPLKGWIEVVYRAARERIERGWHALDWYDRMTASESDDDFFSAWRLFAQAADRRIIVVPTRCPKQIFHSLPQRRRDFVSFAWNSMARGTEREKPTLENNLYTFPKGFRWALPWGR